MKKITVDLKNSNYDIFIKKGILHDIANYIDTNRQTVIITDDFIPVKYQNTLLKNLNKPLVLEIPYGEKSKSIDVAYNLINKMIAKGIDRSALIIALGGGVVGDLAGFIASVYLRGVDFIQIPTTLLSQIDSSVGGKVAINAENMKNAIGSFYQPIKVLIDPETLNTLTDRQISNGMAEMIKYGAIYDKDLFYDILNKDVFKDIEDYIYRSLIIKKDIVKVDEFDKGIRQILNFGHTIGHAIEAHYNFSKYFHGEAVGIGMVKITKDNFIKGEIIKVLKKYNLPFDADISKDILFNYIKTDKKVFKGYINLLKIERIGKVKIVKTKLNEIKKE